MSPRKAYPIKESAHLLGVSNRTVWYAVKTGKLGYCRIGRRALIPHTELERFIRRATVKPTAELDADESIRPKNKKAPSGELEALREANGTTTRGHNHDIPSE